jgi:hypothetical protein
VCYSIKISFCHIQGCSREEIFVSLKEVGQVGLIFYILVNLD